MGKRKMIPKIPLEERLRHTWTDGQRIPAIFGVYLDGYYGALSKMSGRPWRRCWQAIGSV